MRYQSLRSTVVESWRCRRAVLVLKRVRSNRDVILIPTRRPKAADLPFSRGGAASGDASARRFFSFRGNAARRQYDGIIPPSTTSTWPVTKDAAGEARKTAAPAISSGLAQRPSALRP